MNASTIFLDELRQRAGATTPATFDRTQILSVAAHDAYESAANRLTQEHGWPDERALVVLRGLNGAVQRWLEQDAGDWDVLGAELQRVEESLHTGGPEGPRPADAESPRPADAESPRPADRERPRPRA